MSYVFTKVLLLVFLFAFVFHCHLFSPCWWLAFLISSPPVFMFFLRQKSSPFFYLALSLFSTSVKTLKFSRTRLCCCFLSLKSPCSHVISSQKTSCCIWVAIPVDWVILHWRACGADGRVYGHVTTKYSRMHRVCCIEMIRIRISDPRSLGSWSIKCTDESLSRVDSSVHLFFHDPSDLGSLIMIRIVSKERTHRLPNFLTHGAPMRALRARESSAISIIEALWRMMSFDYVF